MSQEMRHKPCCCKEGNPSLQDLLDDPIILQVMERDGVKTEDIIALFTAARKRLLVHRWRSERFSSDCRDGLMQCQNSEPALPVETLGLFP